MADFDIAYGETAIHEGGYVHDPVDRGGETHCGVSRRFHPDWAGWPRIDRLKREHPQDFVRRINADAELAGMARQLYHERYWKPLLGDQIPDQHVANKLFDTGVHQGVATSIRYLQESLNLLNRDQRDYADTAVDGKMGPASLAALNAFLKLEKGRPDYLLKLLNILQALRYVEILRRDPGQQKYTRGWLNRVDLR
jgi:lysozyme family protein